MRDTLVLNQPLGYSSRRFCSLAQNNSFVDVRPTWASSTECNGFRLGRDVFNAGTQRPPEGKMALRLLFLLSWPNSPYIYHVAFPSPIIMPIESKVLPKKKFFIGEEVWRPPPDGGAWARMREHFMQERRTPFRGI